MSIIDSQGVEALRIRLDHVERELVRIKARLRALPLSEPIRFPSRRARHRFQNPNTTAHSAAKGRMKS